jgi:hypothetical protein
MTSEAVGRAKGAATGAENLENWRRQSGYRL